MTKIDLSGKGAWQSKSGDKLKALQNGDYQYREMTLSPDSLDLSWIEPSLIIQVKKGDLKWKTREEILAYEEGEMIYLNAENPQAVELIISSDVTIGIFKEIESNNA